MTKPSDKSTAEVFPRTDNPHLAEIHQWKCSQILQDPTNSSLLKEIHSSIYESWMDCGRALLKRSNCSCPVLPRWSSPRSKFIGPLMHLPEAIKKKKKSFSLFPCGTTRDKVLVELTEGQPSRRAISLSPLPSWMPFTFSCILQYASELHVRKRKPTKESTLYNASPPPTCALKQPWRLECVHHCLPACPCLFMSILLDFLFPQHSMPYKWRLPYEWITNYEIAVEYM